MGRALARTPQRTNSCSAGESVTFTCAAFLIAFLGRGFIIVPTEAMDVHQEQKAMRSMDTGSMSRRALLTAVVAHTLLWLSGCGPGSVAGLRTQSNAACSLQVDADYTTVYNRIALRARWQYATIRVATHQPGVTADLFPESQSATVTLWDSGGIGLRYRLSAKIRAIDPAHTKVDLFAAGKSDRREARLWAAWASMPLEK